MKKNLEILLSDRDNTLMKTFLRLFSLALVAFLVVGCSLSTCLAAAHAYTDDAVEEAVQGRESIDAAIDELIMTFRPPVMTARGSVHMPASNGRGSAMMDVESMRLKRQRVYQQLRLLSENNDSPEAQSSSSL
ncbi:MAG: hypothetical protein ACI9CF_000790 [Candidatus Omnitrophota bacterium]